MVHARSRRQLFARHLPHASLARDKGWRLYRRIRNGTSERNCAHHRHDNAAARHRSLCFLDCRQSGHAAVDQPGSGPVPTGFVLEAGITPGQVLASISTGSTAPTFTFTAPSGAFYVRLHTIAGANRSPASNEIRIFVNQPVAPSAPANLLATVNGSMLGLAWRNTFAGGTPQSMILDVSGSVNASLPLPLAGAASFASVPAGTYTLRLRAANASGTSGQSNAVTITVPSACTRGAPQVPAEFLAYRVGNTIYVMWEPATDGARRRRINSPSPA